MESNCEITETEVPPEYYTPLVVNAEFHCEQNCGKKVCQIYCEVYQRHVSLDHRTMTTCEEPTEVIKCADHPKQEIDFWCNDCEKLACGNCVLLEHITHNKVMAETAAKDLSTELINKLDEIQSSVNQRIQQTKEMIGTNEEMNTKTITEAFAILRLMIDEQEKTLKQQIVDIERRNQTLVEEYQRQLEYKERIVRQKNEYVKSSVTAKEHVQLLQAKEQLTVFVKEITEALDELKPPVKTDYQIQGLDQLETCANDSLKQVSVAVLAPENYVVVHDIA